MGFLLGLRCPLGFGFELLGNGGNVGPLGVGEREAGLGVGLLDPAKGEFGCPLVVEPVGTGEGLVDGAKEGGVRVGCWLGTNGSIKPCRTTLPLQLKSSLHPMRRV
jgi:hypothetical protein